MPLTIEYTRYAMATKVFAELERKIIDDIEKSKLPLSNKALYYNIRKIDILLESIQNSMGLFYASQVLMRVILEHFLVGYYIWTRSDIDCNDKCGEEYNFYYFCSEFLKREGYQVSVDNIKNSRNDKLTIPFLKDKYGSFDMEQAELEQIHKIANQFDIRNIGRYIVNNISEDNHFKQVNTMLLDFLDRYNFLSSYVHGGPFSEQQTFFGEFNNGKSHNEIEDDNLALARMASRQSKVNILFSLAKDFPDEYKQPLEEILYVI